MPVTGPICERYVDPLCLSAWTCLFSTLQSSSSPATSSRACSGQAWCISVRGPLYSAMFTPLCTVLTTALSAAILHEELHVGSLVGAVAVIAGLYIVLWGKAEDARIQALNRGSAKAAADVEPHPQPPLDLENTLASPLMAGVEPAQ